MYSYVLEFDLKQRGEDSEEYLADAVRTWPGMWERIPGVTRTMLLCGAFALGGEFTYAWRVDMDTLGTFSRIEDAMVSGEGGWRETRREWFRARAAGRANVFGHLAGNRGHLDAQQGRSGAIHLIVNRPSGEDGLRAMQGVPGVVSAQALRPVLGTSGGQDQIWLRLEGLEALDAVGGSDGVATGHARLFGEMREVDGSLFVGA